MKKILLSVLVVCALFSCKKNSTNNVNESAEVTIKFNNKVSGQPVEYGKYNYTNEAGNVYNITLLKYYVSNVILIAEDGAEVKLNNYDLINAFDTQDFSTVNAGLVPNNTYKSIRFGLGVDSIRNHNGAQDGDLDPLYNMIWTWNTGYLFMKHEGKFINNTGDTTDLEYHLGTDLAYTNITVPIDMKVYGSSKILYIDFDLNKMYYSPVINFNDDNIRHSTDALDKSWISAMKINAQTAFTFAGVN